MAGIVASRGGASYPNDKGVAPGADIHSGKVTRGETSPSDPNRVIAFTWLADALDTLVNDHDCGVIVTGISVTGIDPNGQSQWTLLYDYYAYEHDVVFAIASGNFGSEVHIFGDAYNGITTGGLMVTDPNVYLRVGSGSNSGPTSDGRRKPDVVAPSQNQTMPSGGSDTSWYTWTTEQGVTSLSTPHTAGIAALLLGLAEETAEPNDGHNEVIKAVIVNSAFPNIDDKAGNGTNPSDVNNIWHQDRGYGRTDALRAYQILAADRIYKNATSTADKGWAFDTVAVQQEHTYRIQAQRHDRLVATLTWERRIEWNDEEPLGQIDLGELYSYLSDLDLRVYAPDDSNAIFSEQNNNLDPNDNLEKCDILLAADGDYTVKIVNDSDNGEIADYGLAFELRPAIIGDFAPVDYIVDYADLDTVAQNWLVVEPNLEADLAPDGTINLRDFAEFASYWLETDHAYYQQQ